MDLQKIRSLIKEADFSGEAKEKMVEILDKAIEKGGLGPEEKQRLLGIIDLEIERENLEADALEEIALALKGFTVDVEGATEIAAEEIEKTEEDFKENLETLKREVR